MLKFEHLDADNYSKARHNVYRGDTHEENKE